MSLLEDEVREACIASTGYTAASLDAIITGSEEGEGALADFIGDEDGRRAVDVKMLSLDCANSMAPRCFSMSVRCAVRDAGEHYAVLRRHDPKEAS